MVDKRETLSTQINRLNFLTPQQFTAKYGEPRRWTELGEGGNVVQVYIPERATECVIKSLKTGFSAANIATEAEAYRRMYRQDVDVSYGIKTGWYPMPAEAVKHFEGVVCKPRFERDVLELVTKYDSRDIMGGRPETTARIKKDRQFDALAIEVLNAHRFGIIVADVQTEALMLVAEKTTPIGGRDIALRFHYIDFNLSRVRPDISNEEIQGWISRANTPNANLNEIIEEINLRINYSPEVAEKVKNGDLEAKEFRIANPLEDAPGKRTGQESIDMLRKMINGRRTNIGGAIGEFFVEMDKYFIQGCISDLKLTVKKLESYDKANRVRGLVSGFLESIKNDQGMVSVNDYLKKEWDLINAIFSAK